MSHQTLKCNDSLHARAIGDARSAALNACLAQALVADVIGYFLSSNSNPCYQQIKEVILCS